MPVLGKILKRPIRNRDPRNTFFKGCRANHTCVPDTVLETRGLLSSLNPILDAKYAKAVRRDEI